MSTVKAVDHAVNGDTTHPSAAQRDEAEKAGLDARLRQNEAAGARVMEFAEDASPEQKGAKARAAANDMGLPSLPNTTPSGTGMASDIGGKNVKATVGLADLDRTSKAEGQLGDGSAEPGHKAGEKTSMIPEYYEVGWTGVSKGLMERAGFRLKTAGVEDDAEPSFETRMVTRYLTDAYYGQFWWNGAVIIVAVLATYFATRFGAGIFGMLVIGAFCTTYYNASMRRTRQRARDDIGREVAKKHMASEHETAEWINHFMSRFWLIYEPVLSATIISTVDATLVAQCPSFLDSIRMTTFTLGTKAPRIDHVRTFPQTEDDVVMMDWKFSFTPNDTLDLTVRQAAAKINPKIVLTIRVGRGFVGAGMPILLEDITFVGNIRLRMKLMSNFPHVQLIDISFMEPPKFDYVLKPVGGNTFGFDIGNIPGLSNFIQEQVHANLGPMMYNPNMFTINLEEMLAGTPLDTAVGVLQVTIWSARGLKAVKLGGGTPDPYVAISIDNKEILAKTKYKHSSSNPQFKETKYILLNNLNGMLTLGLMDYNEHRPDSSIGQAAWALADLETNPEHENLSSPVMLDGKERGEIQYSLSYYPVIKPETTPDGKEQPLPETLAGVVRLTVHQAKELDKRSGLGELNPKARIRLNGNRVRDTMVIKRTNSPIWEVNHEMLVTDRKKAVIGIEVLDDRDLTKDPVVAYLSVKLDDLLSAKERQQDWFPLLGSKRGRLRMSASWKPILMSGSMNGGSGYTPAIGAVKFWVKKAVDVKNVEGMTGGKSDPYLTLKVRGQTHDGTTIVNNNLNPEWNEILYCPVRSLKDRITVELMDYQNVGKDRSLGTTEVLLTDLARENSDNPKLPFASTGRKAHRERLHLGRQVYKGEVIFDCEFLPATNLAGVEFEGAGNEAAGKAASGGGDDDDGDDVDTASIRELSEEEQTRLEQMAKGTVGVTQTGDVQAPTAPVEKVNTNGVAGPEPAKGSGAVTMSREELLKCESGILVFNLLHGHIARKNARLEVLFDDGYWPAYTTERGRTQQCTWDEVGESVIKELDWSRMWLKLRTGDNDDDVFAEFQGNTKDVMERALDKEAEFTLANDGGGSHSTVTLTCKYIPLDIHIEPVESVNNQGFLRVELISAKNLRGADRGGKYSDPYVTFNLNGQRMLKSKVIKKTLNPTWQEVLGEAQVNSRVGADAVFEIFDWDQVGTPDKLGQAHLNLELLEPFDSVERELPIVGKGAAENGTLTVRVVFRPEFVASRERKGTSLGRTLTTGVGGVGKIGIGGVKGVAGVGGAVGKAGFGIGKGVVGGGFNVGKGAVGLIRGKGNRSASVSGADAEGLGIDPATGEPIVPTSKQDQAAVAAMLQTPAAQGSSAGGVTSHDFLNSPPNDITNDAASTSESLGTPSKKRSSKFHMPFKRHRNSGADGSNEL